MLRTAAALKNAESYRDTGVIESVDTPVRKSPNAGVMSPRRFLGKLASFLTVPLLVLVYFEVNGAKVRNNYTAKRTFIEQRRNDLEVLTFGSSHGLLGINPAYLHRRAYNLANNSQSLAVDLDIALKYGRQMPRLRLVLFPVSYFSLEYSLFEFDQDLAAKYVRFFGVRGDTPYYGMLHPRNYLLTVLYGPVQMQSYFLKHFEIDQVDVSDLGWFSKQSGGPAIINDEKGLYSVQYHHRLMHPDNLQLNLTRVQRFLDAIKKTQIVPVFVTTPVWKTYSKAIDTERWQMDLGQLKALLAKYDVKYYDFMTDSRFVVEDFADNDHLNEQGAAKFTRILDESVIEPALGGSPATEMASPTGIAGPTGFAGILPAEAAQTLIPAVLILRPARMPAIPVAAEPH